jgi:hypothetical protein
MVGVTRRIFGLGRLTSKKSAQSYWVDKAQLPKDHFERQR